MYCHWITVQNCHESNVQCDADVLAHSQSFCNARHKGAKSVWLASCELLTQLSQHSICEMKGTMTQVPQPSMCGPKGIRQSGDVQFTRMPCFFSKIHLKMIHYCWDPCLHVFIKLGTKKSKIFRKHPKYRWYMTLLQVFRNGSTLQYVFAKDVRNYQNCSEIYEIDPFIGELPNEIWRAKF